VITVVFVAFTAEHLVTNIRGVEERFNLKHQWFGLILLPFVSYSADGVLSVVQFFHSLFGLGGPHAKSRFSSTLAQGRSIDLAIQFLTFWLPFVVIVSWWVSKPMSLLFNIFEVVVLVGSCFLVTFVTVDAKTNWAEGLMMVIFYVMIAIAAWFYPGQSDIRVLHSCLSVSDAIALEHQAFAALQNETSQRVSIPLVGGGRNMPSAQAVDALNERLQQILDLHHVVTNPSAETRTYGQRHTYV